MCRYMLCPLMCSNLLEARLHTLHPPEKTNIDYIVYLYRTNTGNLTALGYLDMI